MVRTKNKRIPRTHPVNPVLITKSQITQKEFENGIWQFFMDHAKAIQEGQWLVRIGCSTKEQLMRRIYSRATGAYIVKDEAKQDKEMFDRMAELKIRAHYQDKAKRKDDKINKLPKWKRLVIMSLRKFTNKIINKWI